MRGPVAADLVVVIVVALVGFGYISTKHLNLITFVAVMGVGFILVVGRLYRDLRKHRKFHKP
jgi:hypothetical protein